MGPRWSVPFKENGSRAGLAPSTNPNAKYANRDKKRPPPKNKTVSATYGANRRLAWSKEDFTQYSKIGSILLSLVRRRGGRKVSPGYCQTSPPDVKDVRILLEMWVGFGAPLTRRNLLILLNARIDKKGECAQVGCTWCTRGYSNFLGRMDYSTGGTADIAHFASQQPPNDLVGHFVLGSEHAALCLKIGLDRILGFRYNGIDRKSTRLNSSHVEISYAVFCLKKK